MADNARSSKLRNFFIKGLSGKQDITGMNAKIFIEAICDQPDTATCIQRLVATPHGFPALMGMLSTPEYVERQMTDLPPLLF